MSGCVWGCKKIYWANITFGHDTQILRFLPVPSLVRKNDYNWRCLDGVGMVSGGGLDLPDYFQCILSKSIEISF